MSDIRLGAPPRTLTMANGAATTTWLQFPYRDSLRGIAALTVMLYDTYLSIGHTGDSGRDHPWGGRPVGYGYLRVPVFDVLSGYVLMPPVVVSHQRSVPGGFLRHVRRRARRVLPPYRVGGMTVTMPPANGPDALPYGSGYDRSAGCADEEQLNSRRGLVDLSPAMSPRERSTPVSSVSDRRRGSRNSALRVWRPASVHGGRGRECGHGRSRQWGGNR